MTGSDFSDYLRERKKTVDAALRNAMIEVGGPAKLKEAVLYSLTADGKRIRPILTLAVADLLKIPHDDVMPIGVAMEMIHVFSLIHDDLPAMDDDDLRRGQPTNHKVFGEAAAILAGDALLAQAFVPLTRLARKNYSAENVLQVIRLIAEATGSEGMIGGQIIDLQSEGKQISLDELRNLHRLKTGALIRASVMAPAVLLGASDDVQQKLRSYAESIGLAFQIADDILDIEGGVEIGKDIGSDVARGKSTYPSLMGLDGAKRELQSTLDAALQKISSFGESAGILRELARYIVNRKK